MRIDDPSLWPDDFGDLHFARQIDDEDDEVLIRDEHGVTLALMFRHDRCWTELDDPGPDVDAPARGGWEVVLAGQAQLARDALFQPAGMTSEALSADIIAWATLTILTRMAGHTPGRG